VWVTNTGAVALHAQMPPGQNEGPDEGYGGVQRVCGFAPDPARYAAVLFDVDGCLYEGEACKALTKDLDEGIHRFMVEELGFDRVRPTPYPYLPSPLSFSSTPRTFTNTNH